MLTDKQKAYEFFWSQTTRDYDPGELHCPVAGSGDDEAEFVAWSSPSETITVEFAVGCRGGYPATPASATDGKHYRLLKSSVTAATPVSMNNGEFAYFVAGRYRYGRKKPGKSDDAVPFVWLPGDFGGGIGQHAVDFAASAFKKLSPFLDKP